MAMLLKIDATLDLAQAANGAECLQCCQRDAFDIVFLDIEMPGQSGLEVASALALADKPPVVIFCTAYDEFAVNAFEKSAVDYLLKPVALERLGHALEKAKDYRAMRQAQSLEKPTAAHPPGFVWVSTAGGKQRVALSDIRLLRADTKYVVAVTEGSELIVEGSLKQWEQNHPQHFLRIHRATLVSARHLSACRKLDSGEFVAIVDGCDEQPSISRRHLPVVQNWIKKR